MSRALRPALLVPDEQTWTVWGRDPALLGFRPAAEFAEAQAVVMPRSLPDELLDALLDLWSARATDASAEVIDGPQLAGVAVESRLDEASRADDSPHEDDDHAGHQGHTSHEEQAAEADHAADGDHGDMMAITGEPSDDGLVMEPIEMRVGPLHPALPGGLVLEVSLDGDVVAECSIRAGLRVLPGSEEVSPVPDPLALAAWTAATAEADELVRGEPPAASVRWRRVAAVELERALSHIAGMRQLGRLLAWAQLVEAAQVALLSLLAAQGDGSDVGAPVPEGSHVRQAVVWLDKGLDPLRSLVHTRRLARRLEGRTVIDGEAARLAGVRGPVLRAAGCREDAREGDALYRELGFAAVTREDGDALARVHVRLEEARAALRYAAGALARADDGAPAEGASADAEMPVTITVEGPRGPLRACRSARDAPASLTMPGAEALRLLAAECLVGEEWAGALVGLASFDLSSWRIDP